MRHLAVYATLVLLIVAVAWQLRLLEEAPADPLAAGLEVYVGEGCIHCHSQYRRPVGYDEALWGPATEYESAMASSQPVLFGNRRQGPDLSNVGLRRSREWNRQHLLAPRLVRASSRMPSYAHLFAPGTVKGEALLDYLQSLGEDERDGWIRAVAGWAPQGPLDRGDAARGRGLFNEYCARCHGADGSGSGPLATRFSPAPRDLTRPAHWLWIDASLESDARRLELARLIRHGRPGTAMAGTEWLSEADLADLVRLIETLQ